MNLLPFRFNVDVLRHRQNLDLLTNPPWSFRTDADFKGFWPNVIHESDRISTHRGSPTCPPWSVISDERTVLVLCSGVQNLDQCWEYSRACFFVENQNRETGQLTCFSIPADAISDQPGFRAANEKRRVFVGHSWGGALCSALYTFKGENGCEGPMEAWTYGAPRSVRRAASPYYDENYVRCVRLGDPVCRCYPHFADGGIGDRHILTEPRAALLVNHVVQPRGCITISDAGQLGYSDNPSVSFTANILPAGQFLYSPAAFLNANHSVAAYRSAFQSAMVDAEMPEFAIAQRIPAGEEVREPELRRQYEQALRASVVAGNVPTNTAMLQIQTNVELVEKVRYRRQTRAGIRFVTYNGEVVWICPTVRAQRKLCNELNRTLKF